MEIFNDKRMVPYSSEQMFDLISEVEQYPKFLPGWQYTRVLEHKGNISQVDQEVGWNRFRVRFISQVTVARPARIEITSSQDPFRRLNIRWSIDPPHPAIDPTPDLMPDLIIDPKGCIVHLHIEFEFRSTVLTHVVQPVMSSCLHRIISVFEERAHLVYPGTHEQSECFRRPKAASFR